VVFDRGSREKVDGCWREMAFVAFVVVWINVNAQKSMIKNGQRPIPYCTSNTPHQSKNQYENNFDIIIVYSKA